MPRYKPYLKPGREVPFEFARECMECHQQSLFVGSSKDLFIICRNHFCKARSSMILLPCVLKHRDYQIVDQFSMVIDEGVAVLGDGTPDIFNDVHDPTLTTGPYEECKGFLDYDPDLRIQRDTYLICKTCKAAYHAMIMATHGLIGDTLHHNDFKIVYNNKGIQKVTSDKSLWSNATRKFSIPKSTLMIIDEIRWQRDQLITEPEPFFGVQEKRLIN